MESKDLILAKIGGIFRKELGDESLIVTNDSSPDSIDKWDSINNLVLISAIEEQFGITFSADSIFMINNVGDIVDYIYKSEPV